MLLRRVEVTLGLVDLDRGKNESAQDYGKKAPGNLPQSWWLRAVGVRRLMVVRMKALRLRAWRGEQICGGCIVVMLLFFSLVLWLRDREQLHEKASQQEEKKNKPKLNSNQTNQKKSKKSTDEIQSHVSL